jgi:hypothetical protein
MMVVNPSINHHHWRDLLSFASHLQLTWVETAVKYREVVTRRR